MLLKDTKKKGSITLELAVVFPFFLMGLFLFIYGQMAILEMTVLNQTTAETAKYLTTAQMQEDGVASMIEDLLGLPLSQIWHRPGMMPEEDAIQLLLQMEDSGLLKKENIESISIGQADGLYRAELVYQSSFVSGLRLESRAVERGWTSE